MPITFDPVNKWILLPDVTQITAQQIYNAAKDWEDSQEGMDDPCPMLSTGYAPLGGGAYTDKIFILSNGWKLKPYSGTYTLTIIGTVITDDESNRTVPPDSGAVQVIFQVTSQGIISVTGSGITQQDKEDIADLVETQTGIPIKLDVILVKKIEGNKWKILNNQLIIYDDDGITPIKTFNLKSKTGEPTEKDVYEREPV